MRYEIIDSHKRMNRKRHESLNIFFQKVKQLSYDDADKQVCFCDWFEKEYAVKWFEAVAFENDRVVGYLRCLRNPEIRQEWFIGDVHVSDDYQNRHIMSKLYAKTIEEVKTYEAAERIVSSVHCKNVKSIGLHEKFDFVDTGKPCNFPSFYFDEKETMYELKLLNEYPVSDIEFGIKTLTPIWIAYRSECGTQINEVTAASELSKILRLSLEENVYDFRIIFCGYRAVGFTYWNDKEEEYFIIE